jgi:hypothetical protein
MNDATDLFETPEDWPEALSAVFERLGAAYESGCAYEACRDALKEVEALGYTFDYDLSGDAHDLRKISG